MNAVADRLERETCSRCGGSGRYSFNTMDGDRCYGCGGKGIRLTKRGAAANAYLRALRSKPVEELGVGDSIEGTSISNDGRSVGKQWEKIVAIDLTLRKTGSSGSWNPETRAMEHREVYSVLVETDKCSHFVEPGTIFRVRQNAEDEARTLREALAYQATLTKTGNVAKRSAK